MSKEAGSTGSLSGNARLLGFDLKPSVLSAQLSKVPPVVKQAQLGAVLGSSAVMLYTWTLVVTLIPAQCVCREACFVCKSKKTAELQALNGFA